MVVYKNSTRKTPGKNGQSTVSPNSQSSPAAKVRAKSRETNKRQSMLNTHKLAPFKYDMNELLSSSQMDESKASSFLASVIAKASRVSTKEAKEFVRTFQDAGDLSKEEADKICKLMDKYSKYR